MVMAPSNKKRPVCKYEHLASECLSQLEFLAAKQWQRWRHRRNDGAGAIAMAVHTLLTKDLLRAVALGMAVVVYTLLPRQVLRLAQTLANAINQVLGNASSTRLARQAHSHHG